MDVSPSLQLPSFVPFISVSYPLHDLEPLKLCFQVLDEEEGWEVVADTAVEVEVGKEEVKTTEKVVDETPTGSMETWDGQVWSKYVSSN